jgi:hypothetical protein
MTWKLTFAHLSGKAVQAHVHLGRPGKAGNVLVALCAPCRSGQTGKAKITHDVEDALERGKTYVNVHTPKNLAGEIRGQLKETVGSLGRRAARPGDAAAPAGPTAQQHERLFASVQ